jgi:hypothetical protein
MRTKYMKAKQRKVLKEQIAQTIDRLNQISYQNDLTGVYEGFPKEEYVELMAMEVILEAFDSAINYVEFNEQESHRFHIYIIVKIRNLMFTRKENKSMNL